jgi:hypothetical protein
MGTWGAGLYEDDQASDLKNTIALLSKVPAEGARLLQILEKNWGSCDPRDDDGRLFWLVVADQFERRGIDCPRPQATALSIIASGADLDSAADKGADDKFLKERARARRTEQAPGHAPSHQAAQEGWPGSGCRLEYR